MIVLIYKYGGRLGNRLFAFSHLIAFSKAYNVKVRYPAFDEYAKYFKGTAQNLHCDYPAERSVIIFDRLRAFLYGFNKAYVRILRGTRYHRSNVHEVTFADIPDFSFAERRSLDMNQKDFVEAAKTKLLHILVGRFFRDYRNMEVHQAAVREFFTPVQSLAADVDKFFAAARGENHIVIGVHRRGGDFREFVGGKYYYTPEQYSAKMVEVTRQFPGLKIRFIVCSDEPINLADYREVDAVAGSGGIITDLYTLAKCDYIIGPPSTYSLWASFYGNKPICQLWEIDAAIHASSFQIPPKEVWFNYSFN